MPRGIGDELSIGERIALYRVRRGMTQAVLAGLVGRSEDWLSKIERGERQVRQIDMRVSLSRALRVNLGELTGLPVRSEPRLPGQQSPHPRIDAYVVAPTTANTVAKLALGISDNQALTQVNESLSVVPVVVFPRVNAAHARHPAWEGHLKALRRAGVRLVYGDDVWPLYEPREAPPERPLPWKAILDAVTAALTG